jgi:hypothetical protein
VKKQFVLPLAAMLIAGPAWVRSHASSAARVTVSTSALSFNGSTGNVSSQPLTITSTGQKAVTIQKLSFSNSTFSGSTVALPVTLSKGQSIKVTITAQPKSSAQTGSLAITTTANDPSVSLTETATVASTTHQVNLSWKAPSTTPVAINSYQVDRAVSGSSQYSVVGTTTASSTVFTDTSVQPGKSYVYQVRSVDQSGGTSTPSNSVTLAIP